MSKERGVQAFFPLHLAPNVASFSNQADISSPANLWGNSICSPFPLVGKKHTHLQNMGFNLKILFGEFLGAFKAGYFGKGCKNLLETFILTFHPSLHICRTLFGCVGLSCFQWQSSNHGDSQAPVRMVLDPAIVRHDDTLHFPFNQRWKVVCMCLCICACARLCWVGGEKTVCVSIYRQRVFFTAIVISPWQMLGTYLIILKKNTKKHCIFFCLNWGK